MKKFSKFLVISALALTTIPTNVFAIQKNAIVKATIQESLSLTLSSNTLHFDLSDAKFHTDSVIAKARTNSAAGYTISFKVNNDYNDLKHSNMLVESSIPSITEDKTADAFLETAWAYSIDKEIFKQIPLVSENIFTTSKQGQNDHEFTIGMLAKSDVVAGDYGNEFIFTIVANREVDPDFGKTLSDIETMQAMTPGICEASEINDTKQLRDIRDGKYYWVAKLADGKCWMTQNLDLDLDSNITFTPEDTDISENWTPAIDTEKIELSKVLLSNDDSSPYSFDPGDYYVDGAPEASINRKNEHSSTTPFDSVGERGHVGNYYSWAAAVASNDMNTEYVKYNRGDDVESSICPKGWRLPRENSNKYEDDFYNIIDVYDIDVLHGGALMKSPLYFVRADAITVSNAVHAMTYNNIGRYWSSTSYGYSQAYYRYFTDSYSVSSSDMQSWEMNVRCIAR